MGVSSYFEFITTLFGWILYDNFWTVLADSGVVYIPFIIILFTNIVSSKRAGDDEGSAALQSLKKSETDIIVAIVVLFLAAVPFMPVQLAQMKYVKPGLDCRVVDDIISGSESPSVMGSSTGTTYDPILATIGGMSGRVPIWWGFVHVLTKSVISASVASIPCSGDMSAVNMRLESEKITDPRLNLEIQDFINDCFMPAKSQFIRQDTSALTPATIDETNYLGSTYFRTTAGYYNKYYSAKPRAAFPFSATRDGGFEADSGIGGHPTCREWWSDSAVGLRRRVLNAIDPTIMDEFVARTRNLIQAASSTALSTTQREDILLRKYLAVKNTQANVTGWGDDIGVSYELSTMDQFRDGGIGKVIVEKAKVVVAGIGTALSAPGHLAAGIAAREGSSIFLSLVLMIFVCVLPFLMVFSLYKLSMLMTLSLMFFALNFAYVLWGIAFWVDNHMITAITTGGGAPGMFSAHLNPVQTTIIVWTQRFLYIVFPVFWATTLTWIGFKTNTMMTSMQTMNSGAEAPGKAGGQVASKVATGGATRGLKAVKGGKA